MLTTVYLDGAMGKKFGEKWELAVNSASEALAIIDANKPGLFAWIKSNLATYARYRVVCVYEDGREEHLDNDLFLMERKVKTIRFIPIIEGAGSAGMRFVAGAILTVAGMWVSGMGFTMIGGFMTKVGIGMMIGGAIEMLTRQPKPEQNDYQARTSNYFDGPANTTQQGVPVQLIYGRQVMVGAHLISARLSIDQVL